MAHYRLYTTDGDTLRPESRNPPRRRLGLAVSKAVGNAVTRNGVKRRLRAVAAQCEESLPEQCDVILRAKPSAAHVSYQVLQPQVATAFTRIGSRALTGSHGPSHHHHHVSEHLSRRTLQSKSSQRPDDHTKLTEAGHHE